ncbi:hypothetical protein DICPUDRAFT_153738, partial [Dictyostelium purpureum]
FPVLENLVFTPTSNLQIIHNTPDFFKRFLEPVSTTLKALRLTNFQTFTIPLNHNSMELSLPNIQSLYIGDNQSNSILDPNEPMQFKELVVNGTNDSFLNIHNIHQYVDILRVI